MKDENGKPLIPKDSDPVDCLTHDVHTTWGALSPIQQLAVESGLDTLPELPCLLLPEKRYNQDV